MSKAIHPLNDKNIRYEIFMFSKPETAKNTLALVNKEWNRSSQEDRLWKFFCNSQSIRLSPKLRNDILQIPPDKKWISKRASHSQPESHLQYLLLKKAENIGEKLEKQRACVQQSQNWSISSTNAFNRLTWIRYHPIIVNSNKIILCGTSTMVVVALARLTPLDPISQQLSTILM